MSLNAETYVDWFIESISFSRSSDTAVTVQEAKDFARIDDSFDDSIVDMLIKAAQRAFEEFTATVLYETTITVQYSFDRSGDVEFRLPYGPVDSITSVQVDGEDIDYTQKGRWIEITGHDEETVDIEYVAKRYDTNDTVDSKITLGLQKWIATNYDDRQNTVMETINEMPNGSKQLWASYRNRHI